MLPKFIIWSVSSVSFNEVESGNISPQIGCPLRSTKSVKTINGETTATELFDQALLLLLLWVIQYEFMSHHMWVSWFLIQIRKQMVTRIEHFLNLVHFDLQIRIYRSIAIAVRVKIEPKKLINFTDSVNLQATFKLIIVLPYIVVLVQ